MWRRSFSATPGQLTKKKWDALVIGGGHNGLVAAAYLARGGLSVAVLERRHVIGGRDLELGRHGLKLLKRSPASFTPCLDGRYLLLGPDQALNHSEISKFSRSDAEAYPRYEKQLERFGRFMDTLLDAAPPESLQGDSSFNDKLSNKLHKSAFWARCLRQAASLGQKDMVDFMDLLLAPASKVLNNWLTLATDAVIGSTASVHTPGSGYVLLHHVMGESDGSMAFGRKYSKYQIFVEGGMGSVSMAIANAAKEAGAQIFTNAEVSEVLTEDSSSVKGVLLADGTRVESSVILSNATPYRTFVELVPSNVLPEKFVSAIKNSDYSSATTKINMAVDKLPQFQCCNNTNHSGPGPEHFGTIHIGAEAVCLVHTACHDAESGLPSRRPVIEMTIPSTLDNTISPPGTLILLFLVETCNQLVHQYTPYKPSDGTWEDPVYREAFAQRCFKLIDEYAPGFSSSVISYDMLTPPDLERKLGYEMIQTILTSHHVFRGRKHLSRCHGIRVSLLDAAGERMDSTCAEVELTPEVELWAHREETQLLLFFKT
ncbi:hypothetical protein Bca52824_087750 [Brassica carinata]|uniref:Pyridine nucleotide-disulfide oxidoreductase domain-containing protein 2 n=1 Tax=Brassica carinata TaxID=52824 RepID=A0A8X7PBY6_BRACI|nr:hypothetical protein Bca52824_087750 [Brassica carinata]